MKRVFEVDVLLCSRCGGGRRVVAVYSGGPRLRDLLDRLGLSPPPGLPPQGFPGPCSDDLRAELVAHHHVAGEVHHEGVAGAARGLDELLGVLERVQVGAADPAGKDADQDLAGPGLGNRDVGDHELAISHDGGAHGWLPFPASA